VKAVEFAWDFGLRKFWEILVWIWLIREVIVPKARDFNIFGRNPIE
jgi:hypothetical protein